MCSHWYGVTKNNPTLLSYLGTYVYLYLLFLYLFLIIKLQEPTRDLRIIGDFPSAVPDKECVRTMTVWKDLLVVGTGGNSIKLFKQTEPLPLDQEKKRDLSSVYIDVGTFHCVKGTLVECLQVWEPINEGKILLYLYSYLYLYLYLCLYFYL